MTKDEKYTQTDLKALGLTTSTINRFFPDPELRDNPMYRSAAPMKIYDPVYVARIMATAEFKDHQEKSEKRKISAQKVVIKKREQLENDISEKIKQIKVQKKPFEKVCNNALLAKQDWCSATEQFDNNPYEAQDHVRLRWTVNYIRHELTTYDDNLYQIKGCVGVRQAYNRYKDAVLNQIARIYPDTKDECERQKQAMQNNQRCY